MVKVIEGEGDGRGQTECLKAVEEKIKKIREKNGKMERRLR